jgi:hypothetical protein
MQILRVSDGRSCYIPVPPQTSAAYFAMGSSCILDTGRTLEIYNSDCELKESVPVRAPGGIALPLGDGLAFQSAFGLLLTDARGGHARQVNFDSSGLSTKEEDNHIDLRSGRFTESGRTFCTEATLKSRWEAAVVPRCFELSTGRQIGVMPRVRRLNQGGLLGPPADNSAEASRLLWQTDPFSLKDTGMSLLASLTPFGKPRFPLPGWVVWDYRLGKEVLRLPRTRHQNRYDLGSGRAALSRLGDYLALVENRSLLIFSLPAN